MENNNSAVDLVCIIDDDKIYVKLIRKIIESRNLSKDLLIFSNGKTALDYFEYLFDNFQEHKVPNIIFLDLNMPIMDGWQFLEHFVKIEKKFKKSITLYIVSSSIDPVDIGKANKLSSISGYIVKPLKPTEIEGIFKKEVD